MTLGSSLKDLFTGINDLHRLFEMVNRQGQKTVDGNVQPSSKPASRGALNDPDLLQRQAER